MTFEEFNTRMEEWDKGVMFHSSHHLMMKHHQYDEIIQYAEQSAENRRRIIGYTCLLLVNPYVHLSFILLGSLADNPPPTLDPYYAGRVSIIRECWRYWGLKEKFIKSMHNLEGYWVEDDFGNKGQWH